MSNTIEFTKAQSAAITARGGSLLVSAAAGCWLSGPWA